MKAIEAIRDFFVADNTSKLKHSFLELSDYRQNPAPVVENWLEVEFAFNRLFVGPAALEAPPFSSVYLDAQALVMGKTTMDVRRMYGALGLQSPWENCFPDDHISLELDAVLAMNHIAKHSNHNNIHDLQARFMRHMEAWVPLFAERALNTKSSHPAINHVINCLSDWLQEQTERFKDYESAREESA